MLDLDSYEAAPDPRLRMLIFCHPQNPTGRAFSRAELEAVADFVIRHDLVVVSDEIHADIVYPGNKHIPLASLHPEIAARTVTITSATKSFNIPALRCAVMHFGAPALKGRFERRIPSRLLGSPGVTGVEQRSQRGMTVSLGWTRFSRSCGPIAIGWRRRSQPSFRP